MLSAILRPAEPAVFPDHNSSHIGLIRKGPVSGPFFVGDLRLEVGSWMLEVRSPIVQESLMDRSVLTSNIQRRASNLYF